MKFEIWVEGFRATGQSGTAFLYAIQEADTFNEACKIALANNSSFDENSLTYWGCRLFNNETDARKAFG